MEGILKASYGDRQQQDKNRKVVDRRVAAGIEAQFKARKAAQGPRELPTPPRSPSAVPFWDVKVHGSPMVGHPASPGREKRETKVEIRPGVFHTVEVFQAAGSPVGTRHGRPLSAPGRSRQPGSPAIPGARIQSARPSPSRPAAPPRQPCGPNPRHADVASHLLPCEKDTVQLAPALAQLEEQMRVKLRQAAQLHVTERVVLLRAIAKVLSTRDVDIGIEHKMTRSQFSAVWAFLGLSVSPDMIDTIFNKYGHDVHGRMPVMVFVECLLYGAPRQIMLENDTVQRGAYLAGHPATHTGKILYPECKKGVWPPSDWRPHLADRSAQLPDARLQLEFVYGYDGFQATSPNVFYTATGEVVYFAAAVGIVYNKQQHTQRLFLGHDDDIVSLAIHPDKRTVATGQVGKDPCVIVWDTTTLQPLQKIHQGYGNHSAQALCFSSSGTKLAVVCTDNQHTLYIWDWPRKQLLLERKTAPGAPPSTYGVTWSPFEHDRLVAYGKNFIKFFNLVRPEGGAAAQQNRPWECNQDAGVFSTCKTHTVFSACFLPSGVLLTGNGSGAIGSWKGCRLVKDTQAHAPGPLERRPDGTPSHGGIRCLVLQTPTVLLSGGADGYVIKWDVSSGDLGPALQRIPLIRPEQMGMVQASGIRGLDCLPNCEVLVAGTSTCDVWEVDDTPEVLVQGQRSDLWGLAMNPAYPHVFATACDSDTVIVWSSATRKPVRIIQLAQKGDKARSCAFSPNGEHLAIGMYSGGLKVLEFHPSLSQIYWGKLFTESIDELKYSPCGRYLAVGSHDQHLDIFDVHAGYKRIARCIGHSSTVTHLDWSADSSTIQSNDQAYEILYFNPKTGKQVKENQRDTRWSSWTCVLGFDVMGIWPPDSDGTDINSCDRSPSGRYLLTADDKGKVSLFNYPVVVHQAPALRYGGHSSHVMNVRWATDESYAISVGGRDRCVFQWRILPNIKPPDHMYGRQPIPAVDKQGLLYRIADEQHSSGIARGLQPYHYQHQAQQQQHVQMLNQQAAVAPARPPAAAGRQHLGGGGYGYNG